MAGSATGAGEASRQGWHDCREAWARTIEGLAEADPNIVVVVNDSVGSSKLGGFQKKFPDRVINVGIAEQTLVGVGAGLANGGKIPFVSGASCFLTARALEQVKADVAYAKANVKLVGQSSGIAYGELGPTHHSIEDFAWLRPLDNLTVITPADPWETAEAVKWAAGYEGPVYLRLSRMPVPNLDIPNRVFRPGHAELVREGTDVAILACGTLVHLAVQAANLLAKEDISARVVNFSSLAPFDRDAVRAAASLGAIVTAEEANIRGGLGGAVAEFTAENMPVPVQRVGFPGFLPTGSIEDLFEAFGLTVTGIAAAARKSLARRAR
ncbi:MAG: transketolase C-terminal domain-containing protein [Ancalomicrobiaceae bacterium]|nr:transketolase C-terminal domain-containing protein [Ancalomicrobiaceae bacterium]